MDKRTRKVVKRLSQPFNAVGAYPMCMSLIDNGCNCLVVGDKTGNLHLIGNILKRKLKFPLPLNLIHPTSNQTPNQVPTVSNCPVVWNKRYRVENSKTLVCTARNCDLM